MSLVREILGPKSKYDKSLPYTYEARIPICEGEDTYNSYLSDTICGLVDHLDQNDIKPDEVRIFEIYQDQEIPVDVILYSASDNTWLFRPDICKAFEEHYKGHIKDGWCTFEDRDGKCSGP